jgi:hypothetical protein
MRDFLEIHRCEIRRRVAERHISRNSSGTGRSAKGERAGRAPRDDAGAVLVLALLFLFVVGGVVGSLATWASNDLHNTVAFKTSRTLQYAVSSATETAIQNIRYTPLFSTQSAATPSYCWGSSSPSQVSIDNLAVAVWCTTIYTPTSAQTRVVTFSACPVATPAASCVTSPILQAIVTFGDYPPGYSAPTNTQCQVYCGTSMTVNTWKWGGGNIAPTPTTTTTTVPPTTTTTTVPPTTTTTTVPPTTTTTTTAPRTNGVTASASNSNYGPYYGGQEILNVTNPSSITAMSITINVVHTSGTAYASMYNSFPGGDLTQGTSTSTQYITYTYVLGSGITIPANYSGQVGVNWSGSGTPRVTSGDLWSITSTSGGVTSTVSGTF